jgi:hypothetical protein
MPGCGFSEMPWCVIWKSQFNQPSSEKKKGHQLYMQVSPFYYLFFLSNFSYSSDFIHYRNGFLISFQIAAKEIIRPADN